LLLELYLKQADLLLMILELKLFYLQKKKKINEIKKKINSYELDVHLISKLNFDLISVKQHFPFAYDLMNVFQLMSTMFQQELVVHSFLDYSSVAVVVVIVAAAVGN
jgi:hypothetical protein